MSKINEATRQASQIQLGNTAQNTSENHSQKQTLGLIGQAPSRDLPQRIQETYHWLTQQSPGDIDLDKIRRTKGIRNPHHYTFSAHRGILAYDCKYARENPDAKNFEFNGEAHDAQGNNIWCRHLAHHVRDTWQNAYELACLGAAPQPRRRKKDRMPATPNIPPDNPTPIKRRKYHHELESVQTIAQQPTLQDGRYEEVAWHKATNEIVFKFSDIGYILQKIAATLGPYDQSNVLVSSTNHMMAIKIKRKHAQLSVNFYDPNETATHKRFLFTDLNAIGNLSPTDLTDEASLAAYALSSPEDSATLVLFEPRFPQPFIMQGPKPTPGDVHFFLTNRDRPPESINTFTAYLQNQVLANNGLSKAQKLKTLAAESKDALPGLWRAMVKGRHANTKGYSNALLKSPALTGTEKVALLHCCHPKGTPGLWMAMSNGDVQNCHDYVETVLETDQLNAEQKVKLVTAKEKTGEPALVMPLLKGHDRLVADYADQILNTTALSNIQKIKLLRAQRPNGTPSVHLAIQKAHTDTALAYVDAVLNTPVLSVAEKVSLLEAPNSSNLSPLAVATYFQHAPLTTALTQRILDTDRLGQTEKLQLLAAKDAQDLNLLEQALEAGDAETVQATLAGFFMAEKIDTDQKLDLLAALDATGQMTGKLMHELARH